MTRKQFHTTFNILYDKSTNSLSHPSFLSAEKDEFINLAIREIIKTRFSGRNPMGKGFQQNQKRTDDLRTVVKTQSYFEDQMSHYIDNISDINSYTIDYPSNYWFTVGENVYISSNNESWPKDSGNNPIMKACDVTECTIDNITSRINNSLSEHRLHNNTAKPLRLQTEEGVILYSDNNYYIFQYDLVYIQKPEKFTRTTLNENDEYTGLPEHIHDEIISYAVRLALGSIGDERYQIQTAENQIIE